MALIEKSDYPIIYTPNKKPDIKDPLTYIDFQNGVYRCSVHSPLTIYNGPNLMEILQYDKIIDTGSSKFRRWLSKIKKKSKRITLDEKINSVEIDFTKSELKGIYVVGLSKRISNQSKKMKFKLFIFITKKQEEVFSYAPKDFNLPLFVKSQ